MASSVIDYQMGSLLYRLPQELRDQIYSHLFASTRLSRGTRRESSTSSGTSSSSSSSSHATTTTIITRVKPDPNALAVLRTCRRARHEIGDTWVSHVTFHFEDVAALLDALAPLACTATTSTLLSQIRRVRVGARKLELGFPGSKFRACYGLASALKLLVPGLSLDVLTVLGSGSGSGAGNGGSSLRHDYETLDELVKGGSGWRELRFVSPTSALLGYANVMPNFLMLHDGEGEGEEEEDGDGGGGAREYRFWRRPQPAHWRGVMKERDGESSEPSVMIYRSAQPGQGCSGVLHEGTREMYEQEVPRGRLAMEDFGIWGDMVLLADGEREKEMMIVVRRGEGARCEEKEALPFIRGNIRQEMGGKSWEEIRRDHIDVLDEMRVVEERIEWDTYDDVADYVWPVMHTQPVLNIYAGI